MVNPSFPKRQMVGVFSLELARLYAYLYQQTDKQFVILHALDGYDEVSLTSDVKLFANQAERITRPIDFGVPAITQEQIYGGGTVEASAKLFMEVLEGRGTEAQENVVCANAAMAIGTVFPHLDLKDAFQLARESLVSKKALEAFTKLVTLAA